MANQKLKDRHVLKALAYRGLHINANLPGKAWVGHTPFAYWLITVVKPKILVELGTHGGGSYFTFCDSIKDNEIQTKAYAVDHWRGEEHSGSYTETVYDQIKRTNDEYYANFSSLLRKGFDEALSNFSDGTVDLLHIDGFHSYDAVTTDFNSWFSKLSDESVVLLHDTHEKKEGFGVHLFWEELKTKYPEQCFEFMHSHGLGIIFPKSLSAANNFRIACGPKIDELFELFSLIGDTVYYQNNGRYSLQKNIQITVQQLQQTLINIKANHPTLASNLKSLL